MRRSRPPAVEQVYGFIAPFFRHQVVNHRGVDKRLEPLLTAGAGEVAGGALFYHVLSTLIWGGRFTVCRRKFLYAFGALPADFPVQCVEVARERLFHDRAYRPSAKFADELCPLNQLRRQCQRNVLAVRVRVDSWSWHRSRFQIL